MKEKLIKICDSIILFSLLAAVFFVPLIFDFSYIIFNVFELEKIIFLRLLVLLAMAAYLGKVFLSGELAYKKNKFIFIAFLFLIISWFCSALLSQEVAQSFWGDYDRQQGFFTIFFYVLFFFLLWLNLKDKQRTRCFILVAVLSSVLPVFYGLIQFFLLDPLKWIESFLTNGRIFSTLGQPNFFGHWLILVLPLTVFAYFFLVRRLFPRFLILLLILGQLFCLFYTGSRSAWLGLFGEIWLFIVIFLLSKKKKKSASIFVVASVVLVLSLFSFSLLAQKNISQSKVWQENRIASIFILNRGSVSIRLNYWQAAITDLKQSSPKVLLLGYGPDSLLNVFIKYYQSKWGEEEKLNAWPDRAHNFILDSLLQFGLVGSFLSALIFFIIIRKSYLFLRQREQQDEKYWLVAAGLIFFSGYLINNFFSFSLTATFLYFYLILAILLFIVSEEDETVFLKIRLANFSKIFIWSAFLILATIIFYVYNFNLFLADYYLMKTKIGPASHDCRFILSNNHKAISLVSGNDLFYRQQYFHAVTKCLNEQSAEVKKELVGNIVNSFISEKTDFYFNRGQIDDLSSLTSGYGESFYQVAEKPLKDLLKKNPNLENAYHGLAALKLSEGDWNSALTLAEQAKSKLPLDYLNTLDAIPDRQRDIKAELLSLDEVFAAVAERTNRPADAIKYYLEILRINPFYFTAYKKIANVYYSEKNLDQALWYNKKGYQLDPEDYVWPLAISFLLQEKGDVKEAVVYAKQALILKPNLPEAQKIIDSQIKK